MTKRKQVVQTVAAPEPKPLLKLDLGCGPNKRPDFIGVDALSFDGKVDVVHDLRQIWPWADGSVAEVHCSHFLEHLTGHERVFFFNELYRVLCPAEYEGGKPNKGFATIIVPHWSSERAYGDPTHQWPPVVFFAFYYLNADWRKGNAPHCGYTCNFDVTGGNALPPEWTVKNQETQMFAQTHYINVATDLQLMVVKK